MAMEKQAHPAHDVGEGLALGVAAAGLPRKGRHLQSKVLHLPLSQLLRTYAHSTIRRLASVAL